MKTHTLQWSPPLLFFLHMVCSSSFLAQSPKPYESVIPALGGHGALWKHWTISTDSLMRGMLMPVIPMVCELAGDVTTHVQLLSAPVQPEAALFFASCPPCLHSNITINSTSWPLSVSLLLAFFFCPCAYFHTLLAFYQHFQATKTLDFRAVWMLLLLPKALFYTALCCFVVKGWVHQYSVRATVTTYFLPLTMTSTEDVFNKSCVRF